MSAAVSQDAASQSVFDDLRKELQLRSVADGDFASEHMETGVLMLGACFTCHLFPGQHLLCYMAMCSHLPNCCQHCPSLSVMNRVHAVKTSHIGLIAVRLGRRLQDCVPQLIVIHAQPIILH